MKLFINSLPKSGTHLLSKTVELFGYHEHFDPQNLDDSERVTPLFFNYREVKNALAKHSEQAISNDEDAIYVGTLTPVYAGAEHFRRWFGALASGSYILGHVGYSEKLSQILAEIGVHHLFIIRDPRAVIASLLSFILDTRGMPRPHFLEADFREMSPDQRLNLLLEGGYAPKADVHVTPFANVYNTMWSWHRDPRCLTIRFEDLVGPSGGGSESQQREVVQRVAATLDVSFDALTLKLTEIYSSNARTFRAGKIDGWKESLDPSSIKRLMTYCEPLCASSGYEN